MRRAWRRGLSNQVLGALNAPPTLLNPRGLVQTHDVPNLSIAIQNCDSLNISTICNRQLSKILAITALCTDFIVLSDLRFNSNHVQVEKIKKIFKYNPNHSYKLFYHSTDSSRGVGILISSKLDFKVVKEYKDNAENIYGMLLSLANQSIQIFSVYGPNTDSKPFFDQIDTFLNEDRFVPSILAGDWNATYSTGDRDSNIDIYSMANPPSITRSGWLQEICTRHHLSDPFRALHPTRRDFTFVPRGGKKTGHV